MLGADADGGAVGRAPFTLHKEDCKPVSSGTFASPPSLGSLPELLPWQFTDYSWRSNYAAVYPDASDGGRLRTRFYGPVKKGTNAPVVVQRFNTSTSIWDDVTTDFEIATVTTTDSLVRDVFTQLDPIVNEYCPGTLHRIIRNDLKCAYVTGSPDVSVFAHYFRFGVQANPADVAGSGGVAPPDGYLDNNDFVLFIDYFFAHDPRADLGVQGGGPGQDGQWNNDDFVAQTDIFFSGPNQSCSIYDNPSVPFELPGAFVTNEPATDRQLNALWIAMDRAQDPRVATLFVDTVFGGTQ